MFSGLWSGLLAMLTLVMHPMLAAMDGRDFAGSCGRSCPPPGVPGSAWDPEAVPADWEATRRRYFTLNWVRAAMTWTAFALSLAALVVL